MYEVMRWFSLGLSFVALGFSCYSARLAFHVNKVLSRKNLNLLGENARLREKIEDYEGEILRLRGLLKGEEASDEGND